jgi:hypothetical protein
MKPTSGTTAAERMGRLGKADKVDIKSKINDVASLIHRLTTPF